MEYNEQKKNDYLRHFGRVYVFLYALARALSGNVYVTHWIKS